MNCQSDYITRQSDRMNGRLKIALIALLFCLLTGLACKKVIQVDLNNAAPQIVIEGEITNHPGPYQVKITKTVNFSATNVYPPVTGATVIIKDSGTGVMETLRESAPGVYITNILQGIPQH